MGSSIRLLYVIEQDRPSRFYEHFFALLHKQTGFEILIFNLYKCEALNEQLRPFIKAIYDPPPKNKYWKQLPYLRKLVSQLQPDIIHCHETIPTFYAGLASIGFRRKLIYHRHHSFYHNRTKKIMDMVSTVLATKIICVSKASLNKAISEHPVFKKKFTFIYNGVLLDDAKPYLFETEDEGKVKVLFLARLKPRKGHMLTIEAVKKLIKDFKNIIFYFAGDGELKDLILQKINDDSLSPFIKLLGNVSNVSGLLQAVDFVILPSESEAFSLTVLETLAAKRLLIASNLPSIEEVITNGVNGVLISPFDATGWARAILKYATNKNETAALANEGYKRFETNFTMGKMVIKFSFFYKQLVFENG